jgi:hypothetical protein
LDGIGAGKLKNVFEARDEIAPQAFKSGNFTKIY